VGRGGGEGEGGREGGRGGGAGVVWIGERGKCVSSQRREQSTRRGRGRERRREVSLAIASGKSGHFGVGRERGRRERGREGGK